MPSGLQLFLFVVLFSLPVMAQKQTQTSCTIEDRVCILQMLEDTAVTIENANWRDQVLRELAKTYAAENNLEKAMDFIGQIETPDTKAMTIRGIGMAAADNNLTQESYKELFTQLRTQAETIEHPPSYAIALTYIAMAQAFANDNEGAWTTAADMENKALRNKAYAETAEIQAEKGNADAAMKSIAFIDDEAFRNKAYAIVSGILAEQGLLSPALKAAEKITNSYKKAESLQNVLDAQKPREK